MLEKLDLLKNFLRENNLKIVMGTYGINIEDVNNGNCYVSHTKEVTSNSLEENNINANGVIEWY